MRKSSTKRTRLFAALLLAGMLGGVSPALADDATTQAQPGTPEAATPKKDKDKQAAKTAADEDPFALPAVVVTAEKRETEVQKTPMALTVLTRQDIEDGSIHSIDDVLQRIPNLQVSHFFGGSSFMTFRGMPTATGTSTNPLVVYIDGVPADTMFSLDANLMDIERVEVLRGAQSVVYGKNTLGGIVNIITRKPDNNFAGKLFARTETPGSYAAGASVSGPIQEDALYFSLSAMHDYTQGYMSNRWSDNRDHVDKERVKGRLRATPTEDSDFSLIFDYTTANKDRPPYSLGDGTSMKSQAAPSDYEDFGIFNAAFTGKVDFDALTFESISTFRMEEQDYAFDMGKIIGAPYADGGRDVARTELTQEFRFRSPDTGTDGMAWLAGIYGSYADLDMKKIEQKFLPMGPLNPYLNQPYREFTQDVAPFGQLEFPLADDLKLTTGLRWHHTEKSASINYKPNADLQAMFPTMVPMSTRENGTWEEWLPRINLSWQITDDHMAYAGVSRSFIPGGYNFAATKDYKLMYESEKAWNYEMGAKTSWFGKRLTVNPVLYYIQLEDLQVMSWDPAAGVYSADNAGKATSYGAELDIIYRLLPGLDAELSVGYTHATFDDYSKEGLGGTEVFDNNRIPNTPQFSGMAALQYRHESGFFARGEVYYTDKLYWDEANDFSRDDVVTVNARVGYEMDSVDVYLYGRNVFDERYQSYFSSANKIGFTAEPQTFGLEVAYRF